LTLPATVTLSTTTLAQSVGSGDRQVKVLSTSGLIPGLRLFVDGELMTVVSLGIDSWVNVLRGVDGSAAQAHSSGNTIFIGRGDQFYSSDPTGEPPAAVPVDPYINVINGAVFYAQGDSLTKRWWQKRTTTYEIGALGIPHEVNDPASST
jgi:hypothetical protein